MTFYSRRQFVGWLRVDTSKAGLMQWAITHKENLVSCIRKRMRVDREYSYIASIKHGN